MSLESYQISDKKSELLFLDNVFVCSGSTCISIAIDMTNASRIKRLTGPPELSPQVAFLCLWGLSTIPPTISAILRHSFQKHLFWLFAASVNDSTDILLQRCCKQATGDKAYSCTEMHLQSAACSQPYKACIVSPTMGVLLGSQKLAVRLTC